MNQSKLLLGILSVFVILVTSCSDKNDKKDLNPLLRLSRNIVSTRPQNSTQFVAILKLKSPALMESGVKQKGRLVIDEGQVAVLNKEQDEAIAALKALSSQVQVIYKYKMVLNGLAVLAPVELAEKIKGVGLVAYSEASGTFESIQTAALSNSVAKPTFSERNSSKFIGADKLNQKGITGKGISVGIIDTGIDYTHAMMAGVGTEDAYKAVNPSESDASFPNRKVVGGIDLVGTEYDAASPEFSKRVPKPDMNPLDEGGHGTHVAGTVAGLGDGVNSYNGMAPEAALHAIKVFGAKGSTSDFVVIAALEYAADPNTDGKNSDQLDVVNLSLGSSYGNPHILYAEAVKNLVNGGTVVVASAGNSGPKDYIVGAPGTSGAALSVAASIDNGDHLWKFNASKFIMGEDSLLVEAIEAATSKRIQEAGNVNGKVVFAGIAATDFDADMAAKIKGNIALIDRGQVNFNDKIKRAVAAGAIGVVIANNKEGSPIVMGTTDKFDVPAIMIKLADANVVKEALKIQEVHFEFQTDAKIEKPELIDTLTDFSSKGPRSIDGFIKPEVSAPGENVISAAMGEGAKTVQMSGTSMAAPHVAGIMALLKQAQPELSADEMKSLVMGRSKTIGVKGGRYPISQQGAGRVQIDDAVEAVVLADVQAISIGEIGVESKKTLRRSFNVRNLTSEKLELDVVFEGNGFISMAAVPKLALDVKATGSLSVSLTLDAGNMKDEKVREMDGWVKLMSAGVEVYRIPVLAVAHKLSAIEAGGLVVKSTSEVDAAGAEVELLLKNTGANAGEVLLFNLIGEDERKPRAESFMTSDCDLQSAGYRLMSSVDEKGVKKDVLQVAVKLFKPMTTWHACDISLLIDNNGDGLVEQELLGSHLRSIPGLKNDAFATTLIDATKARDMRKAYEAALDAAKNDPAKLAELKEAEDYSDALLDQSVLKQFNNSSVVVLQISTDKLALTRDGALSFKLLVTHNEQSSVEFDDQLSSTLRADMRISLRQEDQSFLGLPESLALAGSLSSTLTLTKGEGREDLMVLMPHNRFSLSNLHADSQSTILKPIFKIK